MQFTLQLSQSCSYYNKMDSLIHSTLSTGIYVIIILYYSYSYYYIYCDCMHAIIRKCLAVVLENLLKRELHEFMLYWNTHSIRYNSYTECPSGIPNDLYEMPEEFGQSLK